MALIVCPECKKSVSSSAKVCPNCGYTLRKSFLSYIINIKVIFTAIVLALAVAVGLHFFNGLDKYETIALKDCKTLQSRLKNPDSFTLFDDIYVYAPKDSSYCSVFISYGGTNSYGGMVRDLSLFRRDTQYYGDYDYDESNFNSQEEYDRFILSWLPYKLDRNSEDFIRIDADKIMKHMK